MRADMHEGCFFFYTFQLCDRSNYENHLSAYNKSIQRSLKYADDVILFITQNIITLDWM